MVEEVKPRGEALCCFSFSNKCQIAMVIMAIAVVIISSLNHFNIFNFLSNQEAFYGMIVPSVFVGLTLAYKIYRSCVENTGEDESVSSMQRSNLQTLSATSSLGETQKIEASSGMSKSSSVIVPMAGHSTSVVVSSESSKAEVSETSKSSSVVAPRVGHSLEVVISSERTKAETSGMSKSSSVIVPKAGSSSEFVASLENFRSASGMSRSFSVVEPMAGHSSADVVSSESFKDEASGTSMNSSVLVPKDGSSSAAVVSSESSKSTSIMSRSFSAVEPMAGHSSEVVISSESFKDEASGTSMNSSVLVPKAESRSKVSQSETSQPKSSPATPMSSSVVMPRIFVETTSSVVTPSENPSASSVAPTVVSPQFLAEKRPKFSSSLIKAYVLEDVRELKALISNAKSFNVDMSKFEIWHCLPSDKMFLYTSSLATCIGVTAYCQLADGSKLIGVVHIAATNHDLLEKFMNSFKNHPLYKDEEIHFTLSGGWGYKVTKATFQSLKAYINFQPNCLFVDSYFNPFESTEEIDDMLLAEAAKGRYIRRATIAGVTSQGEVIFKKCSNITFKYQLEIAKKLLENKDNLGHKSDFI